MPVLESGYSLSKPGGDGLHLRDGFFEGHAVRETREDAESLMIASIARGIVVRPLLERGVSALPRLQLETGREDTDDRVRLVAEIHDCTNDIARAPEPVLPERVVENQSAGRTRCVSSSVKNRPAAGTTPMTSK